MQVKDIMHNIPLKTQRRISYRLQEEDCFASLYRPTPENIAHNPIKIPVKNLVCNVILGLSLKKKKTRETRPAIRAVYEYKIGLEIIPLIFRVKYSFIGPYKGYNPPGHHQLRSSKRLSL